jgi:hypothetical protein
VNGEVQQRGRLERLKAAESRDAGPVCCSVWFGGRVKNAFPPRPLYDSATHRL